MKYISYSSVLKSISMLKGVDLFYLTTFLVFKLNSLPVGRAVDISITVLDREFMDLNFRPIPESKYYFRLSRTSNSSKDWLDPKFPEGGLQRTRTTKFKEAFIHESGTSRWGWSPNYLEVLRGVLPREVKINLLAIALWLYKYDGFEDFVNPSYIQEKFLSDFKITRDELELLFDCSIWDIDFTTSIVQWSDFASDFSMPPDLESGSVSGAMSFLSVNGMGNVMGMEVAPGKRLNLFFGENSAGKTLLLDSLYWMLSSEWPNAAVKPNPISDKASWARWAYEGNSGRREITAKPVDVGGNLIWQTNVLHPKSNATVLYFKSDNTLSLYIDGKSLNLTQNDLYNGLKTSEGLSRVETLFSGLYEDMHIWGSSNNSAIDEINSMLEKLSPTEKHGSVYRRNRIRIVNNPEIGVVVKTKFGLVPIHLLSSGIRKIVLIAYILIKTSHSSQMVVLIDEIENHLHPTWQRTILVGLIESFSSNKNIQIFATTHSNIIVGSIENYFKYPEDRLFLFNPIEFKTEESEMKLAIEEIDMVKQGKYSGWLTYEVFGLASERPVETEVVIFEARALQLKENVSVKEIREVGLKLRRLLPPFDDFWPLWMFFEQKNGVNLD